jgi:hypothetical protein
VQQRVEQVGEVHDADWSIKPRGGVVDREAAVAVGERPLGGLAHACGLEYGDDLGARAHDAADGSVAEDESVFSQPSFFVVDQSVPGAVAQQREQLGV